MSGYSPVPADVSAAIHGLLAEFGYRVDNAKGDTVAALFVEDGTLETPHFKLANKADIHAWFSERATKGDRISRHHSTNVRITPLDADRFEVIANALTIVGAPPAPAQGAAIAAGTSSDIVVRAADGWFFQSRKLTVVVEGRIAAPPEKAA